MDPTSVLSIDPPDHLSDEQKKLYSACSPRMKVALAIASDFKDEDQYWNVLKIFRSMGCTDLWSLGSRNMGVTPTKIRERFMRYDRGYGMSLGKASRIKEIANQAMKAQDKSFEAFHEFLVTHGVKTSYRIIDMDMPKVIMSVDDSSDDSSDDENSSGKSKTVFHQPILPLSCPEWHTQKREKSLKRKREEAKDEKEESDGDE